MTQGGYVLACTEVWGGNDRVAQEVVLPGLAGWVYSEPLAGSAAGGDLYYLSACSQGQLARVAVADVSGHGDVVSQVGQCLRELLRKHMDTLDQSALVRDLNERFQEKCTSGKFATVVLVGIYGRDGHLVCTNGGHPPPLWYRAAQKSWQALEETEVHTEVADLPLGLIPGTDYHQLAVRLEPGDLLLLYTDALLEAKNPAGDQLGRDGLLELARQAPVDSPTAAAEGVLAGVRQFCAGRPVEDDQTLVVLQRLPS